MRKTILTALSLCFMAIGCSSSGADNEGETTFVIGAVVPETGPNANPYLISAAELAFAQMNEALAGSSASRGIRFELQKRNDESDNAKVPPLQKELIDLQAKILVGVTSGTSMTLNKANYTDTPAAIPVICGSCTNARLNNPSAMGANDQETAAYRDADNWLSRTTITPDGHLGVLLKDIFSRGENTDGDLDGNGVVKVAVATGIDDNGQALMKQLQDLATKIHPDPDRVVFEHVPADQTIDPVVFDYAKLIADAVDDENLDTKETDGPPDFIIDWTFPANAVGIAKAYSQKGVTIPMVKSSSFRRISILQTLGSAANGQEGVSNQGWTSDDSGKAFHDTFLSSTGAEPAGYDSSAYDSMATALLAVFKAAVKLDDPSKVTGTQVRDALAQLNDANGKVTGAGPAGFAKAISALADGDAINYEGASGPCDFDAVGNIRGNISLFRVENQKFVESRVYDCISDDSCPLAK